MLRAIVHAVLIGGFFVGAAHEVVDGSWFIAITLASLAIFFLQIWLAEQPTQHVCWRCGAEEPSDCDCWVRCWCNEMHPRGERCTNPLHGVKGETR